MAKVQLLPSKKGLFLFKDGFLTRRRGEAEGRKTKEKKNRILFLLDLQFDPAHYKKPLFFPGGC
jgi:hypothetical protein